VRKPEEKRPVGRPRSRWVENIKMDLREIGWGSMDWIDLAQDRDGNERSGSIKCWKVAAQLAGCEEGLSSVELVGGTESQQGLLYESLPVHRYGVVVE
jgi:hypothetical protein